MNYLDKPVSEYMKSMGFTEYDKMTDAFYKAKPTYAEGGVGGKWSIDRDIAEQLFLKQELTAMEARIIATRHCLLYMPPDQNRNGVIGNLRELERQLIALKEQQNDRP